MTLLPFEAGGYRFVEGVFQYSAGVAALPDHRIVRVQFRRPVPLDEGFGRIEKIIGAANRPLTAFCACELRSPAPFSEAGFTAFNKIYVGTLERWKIFDGKTNPVALSARRSSHRPSRRSTPSATPKPLQARKRLLSSPAAAKRRRGAAIIAIILCGWGT